MRTFPIMEGDSLKQIPWAIIEPHREQALRNHGQTLERLQERGGLGPVEAVAVISDKNFYDVFYGPNAINNEQAIAKLRDEVSKWEKAVVDAVFTPLPKD